MKRIDEGIRRQPSQRRRRRRILEFALAGAAEKQEFSAGTKEGLEGVERPGFDSHGADRDEVDRFVELGREGTAPRIATVSTSASFSASARTASRRNTALRVLTSTIRSARLLLASLSGIAGDPPPDPASSNVRAFSGTYRAATTGSISSRSIASSSPFRRESERSEVDLRVPLGEELVIDFEVFDETGVERDCLPTSPGASAVRETHDSPQRDTEITTSACGRDRDSESIEVGADDGNGRRRDAGNALGLAECFGAGFGESLDHLARQARDSFERKCVGYLTALRVLRAGDGLLLPQQVALVLDRRFDRGEVEQPIGRRRLKLPRRRALRALRA